MGSNLAPITSAELATLTRGNITENVLRAVNNAPRQELKLIHRAIAIGVREVIEAAKTKPLSCTPYYPGRGSARIAFRSTPST